MEQRTEPLRPSGKMFVPRLCVESIGKFLPLFRVGDGDEGVVAHLDGNIGLEQLAGPPGVAIKSTCSRNGAQVGTRMEHSPNGASMK